MNLDGKVSSLGENIRTNGITLSRDEKTLYVTNGGTLVAFEVATGSHRGKPVQLRQAGVGSNGEGRPSTRFRRPDYLIYYPETLRVLIGLVGSDRIVVGTDNLAA